MDDIEIWFKKMRHSENYHLGLGDIRLTMGMQDTLVKKFKRYKAVAEAVRKYIKAKKETRTLGGGQANKNYKQTEQDLKQALEKVNENTSRAT